jgi:hypothetical protein
MARAVLHTMQQTRLSYLSDIQILILQTIPTQLSLHLVKPPTSHETRPPFLSAAIIRPTAVFGLAQRFVTHPMQRELGW